MSLRARAVRFRQQAIDVGAAAQQTCFLVRDGERTHQRPQSGVTHRQAPTDPRPPGGKNFRSASIFAGRHLPRAELRPAPASPCPLERRPAPIPGPVRSRPARPMAPKRSRRAHRGKRVKPFRKWCDPARSSGRQTWSEVFRNQIDLFPRLPPTATRQRRHCRGACRPALLLPRVLPAGSLVGTSAG